MRLSIKQQANRIEKWLSLADSAEIMTGTNWYSNANAWSKIVAKQFGIESIKSVATITAILSAQMNWLGNKENVIKFLQNEHRSIFATKKQLQECAKSLQGWRIPDNRLKTSAFASLIANPGIDTSVVIDRHAIKIVNDQLSSEPICITTRRYRDAEKAFLIVADRHQMLGHQIQAITWLTYKRITRR